MPLGPGLAAPGPSRPPAALTEWCRRARRARWIGCTGWPGLRDSLAGSRCMSAGGDASLPGWGTCCSRRFVDGVAGRRDAEGSGLERAMRDVAVARGGPRIRAGSGRAS